MVLTVFLFTDDLIALCVKQSLLNIKQDTVNKQQLFIAKVTGFS
jgi:hypothetical protein